MKVSSLCIVIALCFLTPSCATQLHHDLEERDANEIVSILVARGFKAEKVPEQGKKQTWAITVPDKEIAAATAVLHELKLPRVARLKTQALATTSSLVDTPSAERLRQLEALEGDIEESLETLDGVASAAVELAVPLPARPGQVQQLSKASVLLRCYPQAAETLARQQAGIASLVAASVDGLSSEQVVVLLSIVAVAAPTEIKVKDSNLRPAVLILGGILAVLAAVLVLLSWRLGAWFRRPSQPTDTAAADANVGLPSLDVPTVRSI